MENRTNETTTCIWLTADQVERKLHISRTTLYRWSRLGVLPCYKLSGTRNIYFIDQEIDNFLRMNLITESGRLDKTILDLTNGDKGS